MLTLALAIATLAHAELPAVSRGVPLQTVVDAYVKSGSNNIEVREVLTVLGVGIGQMMNAQDYRKARAKDTCYKILAFTNPLARAEYVPFTKERHGSPSTPVNGFVEPITGKILMNAINHNQPLSRAMIEEAKAEVDGPAFDNFVADRLITVLTYHPALYGAGVFGARGDHLVRAMNQIAEIVDREFKAAAGASVSKPYFLVPTRYDGSKGRTTAMFSLFTRGGEVREYRLDLRAEEGSTIEQQVADQILSNIAPGLALRAAKTEYFPQTPADKVDDRIFSEPNVVDDRVLYVVPSTEKLPNGGRRTSLNVVDLRLKGSRMALSHRLQEEREPHVCDVTRIVDRLSGARDHRSGVVTYECQDGTKLIRRFHDEGGETFELKRPKI